MIKDLCELKQCCWIFNEHSYVSLRCNYYEISSPFISPFKRFPCFLIPFIQHHVFILFLFNQIPPYLFTSISHCFLCTCLIFSIYLFPIHVVVADYPSFVCCYLFNLFHFPFMSTSYCGVLFLSFVFQKKILTFTQVEIIE